MGTTTEAPRFSSGGTTTEEVQQKIRQAREQLLCEDDFQRSMDAPTATRAEILRLLAATRSTWKGIQQAGLAHHHQHLQAASPQSRMVPASTAWSVSSTTCCGPISI